MLRRVRFGAILGEVSTELFENFPRPARFRLEKAPKRAAPLVLQPGHDPQRSPNSVPSVGMLWRVRLRAISDRNFRNFCAAGKFCVRNRARSRPKSAVPHVLQHGHDPQRSPNTVPSVGMLRRRVRFGAILGEFLIEIFEKFSRPRNFAIETARDRAQIRCVPHGSG